MNYILKSFHYQNNQNKLCLVLVAHTHRFYTEYKRNNCEFFFNFHEALIYL